MAPLVTVVAVEIDTIFSTAIVSAIFSPQTIGATAVFISIGVKYRYDPYLLVVNHACDFGISSVIIGEILTQIKRHFNRDPFPGMMTTDKKHRWFIFVHVRIIAYPHGPDVAAFHAGAYVVGLSHSGSFHVRKHGYNFSMGMICSSGGGFRASSAGALGFEIVEGIITDYLYAKALLLYLGEKLSIGCCDNMVGIDLPDVQAHTAKLGYLISRGELDFD